MIWRGFFCPEKQCPKNGKCLVLCRKYKVTQGWRNREAEGSHAPSPPFQSMADQLTLYINQGGRLCTPTTIAPHPPRYLDFPPSLSVTLQQIIRNSWVGELRHDMKVAKKVSCQYLQFRSKVKMHTFRFCYWGSILDRNKRQNVIWP